MKYVILVIYFNIDGSSSHLALEMLTHLKIVLELKRVCYGLLYSVYKNCLTRICKICPTQNSCIHSDSLPPLFLNIQTNCIDLFINELDENKITQHYRKMLNAVFVFTLILQFPSNIMNYPCATQ